MAHDFSSAVPSAASPPIALISEISQLGRINNNVLARLQREVLGVTTAWTQSYPEYQSGGWRTLSLLSGSGDPTDTQIRDCEPCETTLLARMPNTRDFMQSLGLKYMWVRLARLEPNSFLWEHRDYGELTETPRLRLHIPLASNPSSYLIIGDHRIHLATGYIWKLNPTHRHAACNRGREARIHLLLDVYECAALNQLLAAETLLESAAVAKPVLTPEMLDQAVARSMSLARLGYRSSAETLLLQLYHSYSLGEGLCYDLISQMYVSLGEPQRQALWQAHKRRNLGLTDD